MEIYGFGITPQTLFTPNDDNLFVVFLYLTPKHYDYKTHPIAVEDKILYVNNAHLVKSEVDDTPRLFTVDEIADFARRVFPKFVCIGSGSTGYANVHYAAIVYLHWMLNIFTDYAGCTAFLKEPMIKDVELYTKYPSLIPYRDKINELVLNFISTFDFVPPVPNLYVDNGSSQIETTLINAHYVFSADDDYTYSSNTEAVDALIDFTQKAKIHWAKNLGYEPFGVEYRNLFQLIYTAIRELKYGEFKETIISSPAILDEFAKCSIVFPILNAINEFLNETLRLKEKYE